MSTNDTTATDYDTLVNVKDFLASEGTDEFPVTPEMTDAFEGETDDIEVVRAYANALAQQIGAAWKMLDEHVARTRVNYYVEYRNGNCSIIEASSDEKVAREAAQDFVRAFQAGGVRVFRVATQDDLDGFTGQVYKTS